MSEEQDENGDDRVANKAAAKGNDDSDKTKPVTTVCLHGTTLPPTSKARKRREDVLRALGLQLNRTTNQADSMMGSAMKMAKLMSAKQHLLDDEAVRICYANAANALLANETEQARDFALMGITASAEDVNAYPTLSKTETDRDLIRFVTRQIPCHCLDNLKKEAKKVLPKNVVKCHVCEKEDFKHNLKVCGRCKVAQYCSKECQRKAWFDGHDKVCQLTTEASSGELSQRLASAQL